MKKIITSREEATALGLLKGGTYFVRTDTNQPMFIPYNFQNRIDLDHMLITENLRECEELIQYPDINALVKEGKIALAHIYREHHVNLGWLRGMSEVRLHNILKEFMENGFNVTEEAVMHNYEAWKAGFKSGYRDEKNGYHLFTPSGCNQCDLRASSIEKELDWQNTYTA